MRLVACPQCRLQLDLTDVEHRSVRCRCGELVENHAPDGLDLQVHRCSSCGGSVAEGVEECGYCGCEITRDRRNLSLICPGCFARNAEHDRFCSGCGLHFEPVKVDNFGQTILCPDCETVLQPHLVGDVRVSECVECNGIWVPEDRFEVMVSRALDARRKADPAQLSALRPRIQGANPATQRVRYRKCLVCQEHMQRRNFRKTSGVIIDRCRYHGTWLDADELERIAGFLMNGGRPTSDWYIRNEEASSQRTVERRPFEPMAPIPIEGPRRSRSQRDSSGMGMLLRIFNELIG